MNDTQRVLLQLMKELDEFCQRHDITYYLVGGSALGAVRHHGFLPWDDDADIVLTWDEYQKFIAAVRVDPAFPPQDRAYEDTFLGDETVNVFGRYSDTSTTCIFPGIAYAKACHGIKVDVFILLPCPDEGVEREKYLRRFRAWAEFVHPTARNRAASSRTYRATCALGRVLGVRRTRDLLFRRLHVERYASSKQYLYGYERLHVFYDRAMFEEPVYMPFEDAMLPVPTRYQAHFRAIFGDDWFIVPSEEEQVTHLICEDTTVGYEAYTKDYFEYGYRPDDRTLRRSYKACVFEFWEAQRPIDGIQAQMRAGFLREKYERYFRVHALEFEDAFEEGRYGDVVALAEPYLGDQLNVYLRDHGMAILINEDIASKICLSLLFVSEVKRARRLLELVGGKGELEVAAMLLAEKDGIVAAFEAGAYQEAWSRVARTLVRFPQDRDMQWLAIDLPLNRDVGDLDKVSVDSIIDLRRDDADFQKLHADLLLRDGDIQGACELYRIARSHMRNGMLALEIDSTISEIEEGACCE